MSCLVMLNNISGISGCLVAIAWDGTEEDVLSIKDNETNNTDIQMYRLVGITSS